MLPPLLTPLCNGSQNVSRGWSGAQPNESQAFPNLEDIQGAFCQTQCPEEIKKLLILILYLFHLVFYRLLLI